MASEWENSVWLRIQDAAGAKNSKTNEINFFSRMAGYIWLKFYIDL